MKNINHRKVVAKNIKKYLLANKKTQNDVIKDLNISSSVISGWCNGVSFPRIEKLELLADYLNINVVDFFIEENSSKNVQELIDISSQLDKEYQTIILEQAKTLLKMQKSK